MVIISDSADGLTISVHITSTASPHNEVTTLTEATLSKCFVFNEKPERIIEDKAYDSDPLDEKLAIEYGVELIAPHSYNRQAPSTQDGRAIASLLQTPVEDRKAVVCMASDFPANSSEI
jgi:hypothetical protein